jgi:import inner membrane translocase subunit TIM21
VFNRAFSIVKKDQKSINILGGGRLKAYGEQTDNKWARSRPIASRRGYDGLGREHLLMQFHVQGDLAEGLVRLEMVESEEKTKTGIGKYDFRYLVLEVPGQARHYIIDNSEKPRKQSRNTGFLGVRWGKPKDAGDEDH